MCKCFSGCFGKSLLFIYLTAVSSAFFLKFFPLPVPTSFYIAHVGYLLGSIPFGFLLTKFFLRQDVRSIGSGNIGATNVLRTGNKALAAATLLLDALKGALAVYCVAHFSEFSYVHPLVLTAAGFAILGHIYPFWLNFNGGKGIATILGVLLIISPMTALFACAVWAVIAKVFKMSSLAGLISVAATPFFAYFLISENLAIFLTLLGMLIFWRHKDNIKRIIRGEESKIGDKSK